MLSAKPVPVSLAVGNRCVGLAIKFLRAKSALLYEKKELSVWLFRIPQPFICPRHARHNVSVRQALRQAAISATC